MTEHAHHPVFRALAAGLLVILMLGCDGSSPHKANGGTSGSAGKGGTSATGGSGTGHGGQGGTTSATGGGGGAKATGGAGGTACFYAGMNHPVGTTFPSADSCNSCACTTSGIACTERACLPDGGVDVSPETCVLTAAYGYGPIGGNGLYQDQATLTPPAAYSYARTASQRADAADVSCTPALPDCGSAAAIDASDILRDILHAEVQSALAEATPPSYGRDDRPVDGTMFQFLRADGRGFLVGSPCPTTGTSTCVSPPAGIAHLVADLRALDLQQLEDASCAPLR